jgi:hypothetical protein
MKGGTDVAPTLVRLHRVKLNEFFEFVNTVQNSSNLMLSISVQCSPSFKVAKPTSLMLFESDQINSDARRETYIRA